ncbi:hypothetical protein BGW42_008721 [Actinomortierella wolfii]|nr:hypothetical protein BGW42_008721 [Actinomortierella wolfii]
MEDTAVSLAHRYASEAEALQDRYMWEQAIDLHLKAADHFLMAVHDTQSPEVVQTLKLMHANHTRQAKDLRRRLAKVQAAAAKSSPKEAAVGGATNSNNSGGNGNSSGRTSTTAPSVSSRSSDDGGIHQHHHRDHKRRHSLKQQQSAIEEMNYATGEGTITHGQTTEGRRRNGYGESGADGSNDMDDESNIHNENAQSNRRPTSHHRRASDSRGHGHESSFSGSGHGSSNLSSASSSATVEDSFTMIKTMHDDSDPFNKFWEAVENLVQKISSPVAFATIPLDFDEPTTATGAHTNQQQAERPTSNLSSQFQTSAETWGDAPFAVDMHRQPSGAGIRRESRHSISQPSPQPLQQTPQPSQQRQKHLVPPLQKRSVTAPSSRPDEDNEADMADSYYIIDSPSSPTKHPTLRSRSGATNTLPETSQTSGEALPQRRRKTIEEYELENQQLKAALDRLSKRNLKLEKSAQAAMQLKTNMNTWKQEVERRAMQLKQSQDMLRSVTMGRHANQIRSADSSALLLKRPQESHFQLPTTVGNEQQQVGHSTPGTPSTATTKAAAGAGGSGDTNETGSTNSNNAQPTAYELANPMTMQQRLKELTAELEALKLENARQTALMRKYKQRWEDLKEAAKRRRNGVKAEESPGGESSNSNGLVNRAHYEENSPNQRPSSGGRQHISPVSATSPFSNTVVASSASSSPSPSIPRSPHHSGGASSPLRPPAGLARSSSASGPNLHPSGTYQRRIIMESNKGGLALEHISKYRNNHAPLLPPIPPGHGNESTPLDTTTITPATSASTPSTIANSAKAKDQTPP